MKCAAAALACYLAVAASTVQAFTQNTPSAFFSSHVSSNSNTQSHVGPSVSSSSALWSTLEESPLTNSLKSASTTKSLEEYVKERGGNRPIRKVLIANNGMAATKSILSMRQWAYMELGDERAIQFVAMATPEDKKANAEFIRLADSFVEVPGGSNANNYANVEVICKIAKEQGVDAVWPGWGHASEKPLLPETCTELGIKFIGPPAPVMSVLGDKIAANILAQTAKVPSIPWSGSFGGENDGPLQADLNEEGTIPDDIFEKATTRTVEEAVVAAEKIGYDGGLMIKASEGGGGKGIRFVDNEKDLRNAYIQVQNEVVGSPIFIMQLCKNARHLEVQIVGDEHGNAVALNGRDCSTQRRFQKIFEEGPPTIAKPDSFKEMQRAAQRLTQSIGYVGAGTVEYLYNAATDDFFFLELNPRLQVEHPVTEGITGVNMPATQLQVAMGIPLYNIPEVRRMYGKADYYGTDKIDFMTEDYTPITDHVIAARITAENPDEGFKPTSGSIDRIKFQSTSSVWGYFSVGSNGGIHEFADSQFGHLFAKGATREQARKSLILALKEIEVRGEIRTTVEYLVQLLETKAFIENTIDTSWLDGIIKEQSVKVEMPPHLVVVSAALHKAYQHVREATEEIKDSFSKGQVSVGSIPAMNSFPIEIAYEDTKYNFDVTRTAEDTYRLQLGSNSIDAQVSQEGGGALLATFGGIRHRIFGMDEPLGLRLQLDGNTILMPTVFDPSELRTDVTGKVVRYLQDNGSSVENGEPFVEVEAMKMIMPIKATESGKITHNLSPGSVISAGDLLASLELKDPSKVKKIGTFTGQLDIENVALDTDTDSIKTILAGFQGDAYSAVTSSFSDIEDIESASALVTSTLTEFLRVEKLFAGKLQDDVVRELTKANENNLDVVIAENLAHQQLKSRSVLVQAMLREVETFSDRFGDSALPDELVSVLKELAGLKQKVYGEIAISADSIIRASKVPSFDSRVDELRNQLLDKETNFVNLARSPTLSAGVDLLTYLFSDDDKAVQSAAVEVYIRRLYRAHRVLDLSVEEKNGRLTSSFSFQFADVESSKAPIRQGLLSVVPSMLSLKSDMPGILENLSAAIGDKPASVEGGGPLNMIHVAVVDGSIPSVGDVESILAGEKGKLDLLGVRTVNMLVPEKKKEPSYYTFPQCDGYKEDTLRRNMRPTFHHLLELGRLSTNFELERIPAVGKNAQLYVGSEKTERPIRGGAPQVVFLRAISHSDGIVTESGSRTALTQGLDELERAQGNAKISPQSSSRIFLHSLSEIEGASPMDLAIKFKKIFGVLKSQLADRLLRLRVDEIEVKVRVAGPDGMVQNVRLSASSMDGVWLKPQTYLESPDPVTGVTTEFCLLEEDGTTDMCFLNPYGTSNTVQTKRAIARRVGSTYAYDFLGLMEVGLIGEWSEHIASLPDGSATTPQDLFQSQELLEDADGNLVPGNRPVGTNKVGMVSWLVNMKTPEYPEGREVVIIANDVTAQSGSFGVEEDEYYYKASVYAREHKIPRLYISCNAGARIGLVDELKPLLNIKFSDPGNPSKGFDYLYLSDKDYKGLPDGAVIAEKVEEGWKLIDVIGTKHGIGVENLQGSGKIAGETSRAYDEIFTLSYVTGRSVGIGAYLVRLGQRVIQMQQGPIILTGYSALNKLLGRDVYNSQDQLGGPQIMYPNGVSHDIVDDDQAGVTSILKWLSFVPKTVGALPAVREASDPVDRPVAWRPTPTPYDPRLMLSGTNEEAGFFDKGSFKEYLSGWGKSVVVGRGRLGGIPMGAITVETRLVDKVVPADPADANSREAVQPQAGQVLFPDSSYKTAQALRDFDKEGLPVMIFANWRGFSGGSRDMAGEILKFGAMIVDALREYSNPVYIYLPPHGELRGGSWVVVDPTINGEKMEMYADPDSRGGILEPAGITEIKFRLPDQLKVMHRLDDQLASLESELESCDNDDSESIKEQIAAREEALKPVYLQAATEFADLHDKTGRMKAKGVIRDAVPWEKSREFFFWRATRRMAEDDAVSQMRASDASLTRESATASLSALFSGDWEDDKAVASFFSEKSSEIASKVNSVKAAGVQAKIDALKKELDSLN